MAYPIFGETLKLKNLLSEEKVGLKKSLFLEFIEKSASILQVPFRLKIALCHLDQK